MTDFRGFWPKQGYILKDYKIISSAYVLAQNTIMFAANFVRTWLVVWITIELTLRKNDIFIYFYIKTCKGTFLGKGCTPKRRGSQGLLLT